MADDMKSVAAAIPEQAELLAARVVELEEVLCWIRNHYAVNTKSSVLLRSAVLAHVDECLAKNPRYTLPPDYPHYRNDKR
jgi:hypothetical protein